jgi:drug/metabolite transporter (DMT)-like permease
MTVNPLVASLLAAALLGEPVTPVLAAGLAAVFAGIWLASTDSPRVQA